MRQGLKDTLNAFRGHDKVIEWVSGVMEDSIKHEVGLLAERETGLHSGARSEALL